MRLVNTSHIEKEKLKLNGSSDISESWFVIYTKSRHEINVTNRLKEIGIEAVSYTHLTLPTNREV